MHASDNRAAARKGNTREVEARRRGRNLRERKSSKGRLSNLRRGMRHDSFETTRITRRSHAHRSTLKSNVKRIVTIVGVMTSPRILTQVHNPHAKNSPRSHIYMLQPISKPTTEQIAHTPQTQFQDSTRVPAEVVKPYVFHAQFPSPAHRNCCRNSIVVLQPHRNPNGSLRLGLVMRARKTLGDLHAQVKFRR